MVRSLRARLLVGVILTTVTGIAVAGVSISALFRAHVTELVNAELIGHLDELEGLLARTADGHVALHKGSVIRASRSPGLAITGR